MRYFFLLVLVVIAFGLPGCNGGGANTDDDRGGRSTGPLPVDVFVVKETPVSENVQVPGTLLPFEETAIRAEVSGRVVALHIQEGAVVEKGALLVKLFDGDLKAQLRKLEVQLKIMEKTAERNRELLAINGISQQEYELSTLEVDNLTADIETTRISIDKTEIRAPYRGVLGLRSISPGAYLSPADAITSIRQVDRLKLEFSVPEKYAGEVARGYQVSFQVDGSFRHHGATVLATENSVDQHTRTLRVRAEVDRKEADLVSGLFAKVNLQLGKKDKALLVPTEAVIPNIRNKQVVVLRNQRASFSVVETGVRDSAFVEVVHGIQAGDTVVITGLMAIRPDARVDVNSITSL